MDDRLARIRPDLAHRQASGADRPQNFKMGHSKGLASSSLSAGLAGKLQRTPGP